MILVWCASQVTLRHGKTCSNNSHTFIMYSLTGKQCQYYKWYYVCWHRYQYHIENTATSDTLLTKISVSRLVYNMMQGFVLHCVATGSAYKMIWTAKIEKISIPALRCRPNHFICTSGRNTTQHKPLCHIINQLSHCEHSYKWYYADTDISITLWTQLLYVATQVLCGTCLVNRRYW